MDRPFFEQQYHPRYPLHPSPYSHLQPTDRSPLTSLLSATVLLYLALLYFDYPLPSPLDLVDIVFSGLTRLLPDRILLTPAQRLELKELRGRGMFAHAHAVKKEVLRGLLGFGGVKVLESLPAGAGEAVGTVRRASMSVLRRSGVKVGGAGSEEVDAPPGLGNWDNSCYQNCVLQGLASLESLQPYLRTLGKDEVEAEAEDTTSSTLLSTLKKLNDPANNGKLLWTPAKLKKMSSWQQQDAQEYLSKVLEEVEKDASKAFASSKAVPEVSRTAGLAALIDKDAKDHEEGDAARTQPSATPLKCPLDGLLAQKVTCTNCSFSEGLSLIPFNCLTLPLPSSSAAFSTDLAESLDEYTKLEEIPQVECAKCTLLQAQRKLEKMLPTAPNFENVDITPEVDNVIKLPPELRAAAFQRLSNIQSALSSSDFSETTLTDRCNISKKARVSITKTRQAVVARPPRCLVVHVNRSVFDESTGVLRKNGCKVGYPSHLNLGDWMLEDGVEGETKDEGGEFGREQRVGYVLKAVVTHYGRHENGHYVCYRQHPSARPRLAQSRSGEDEDVVDARPEDEAAQSSVKGEGERWWRLSDEDVSPVDEEDVLAQGGVFMLFYERMDVEERPPPLSIEVESNLPVSSSAQSQPSAAAATIISKDEPTLPSSSETAPKVEAVTDEPPATPASTTAESTLESEASSPLDQPSTEATTEDEAELEFDEVLQLSQKPPSSPLRMRTARMPDLDASSDLGWDQGFRFVAAS